MRQLLDQRGPKLLAGQLAGIAVARYAVRLAAAATDEPTGWTASVLQHDLAAGHITQEEP